MAVFTEPTQWTHTLGNNADVSTLPDDASSSAGIASLQKLWQQVNQLPLASGGVAPVRTDVNALFKLLGDSVFYAMQGGVASYNASYDYPVGALVKYNNSIYFCVQANGAESTVVSPDSNRAYWLKIASTDPWSLFPTGFTAKWTSKNAIPLGWLLMNGQSVSKSTYADLNAFINSDGSLNDSGDSSKFIIPDMTGRVWQGCSSYSDVLVAKEAGLPNIQGTIALRAVTDAYAVNPPTGAFAYGRGNEIPEVQLGSNSQSSVIWSFNAQTANATYGGSSTVQPPSRQTLMIIKA
jgi:microcystin-dependent protein